MFNFLLKVAQQQSLFQMNKRKKNPLKSKEMLHLLTDFPEALDALSSLEDMLVAAPSGIVSECTQPAMAVSGPIGPHVSEVVADLHSRYPAGAMMVNARGRVLAITQPMTDLLGLQPQSDVFSGYWDADAEAAVKSSIRTLSKALNRSSKVLKIDTDGASRLAIIEPIADSSGPFLLLRLVGKPWDERIKQQLIEAFSLTETEAEIARLTYQGGRPRDIAEQRNRSIDTIRTQLKNLMRKVNCSGQAELISAIAALIAEQPHRKTDNECVDTISLANGKTLNYRDDGRSDGIPVLMAHTSSDPFLGDSVLRLFSQSGFRLVTPYPADTAVLGQSEAQIDAFVDNAYELLTALKIRSCLVVGLREGGLYAAHFAGKYPQMCRAVLTLQTSVPVDFKQLPSGALPSSATTLISAARNFSLAALQALRMIGQAVQGDDATLGFIIETMHGNDPAFLLDLENFDVREATFRNYRYIYADCVRLVNNAQIWYSDWSKLAEDVARQMPLHFVQGNNDMFHPSSLVEGFCRGRDGISVHAIDGAGQALLYTHTDHIIEEIRKLC